MNIRNDKNNGNLEFCCSYNFVVGASAVTKCGVSSSHNGKETSCVSKVSPQYHSSVEHLIRLPEHLKVPRSPRRHLSDLMYIEHYENGGGYALHSYADEISHLTNEELGLLTRKFFKTLFTERKKRGICVPFSYYCIGVVHGAARRMPELLSFMAKLYPNVTISTNPLERKNENKTLPLHEYVKNVHKTYVGGIYRYGPLHSLSIVGVKGEERGHYCEELVKLIEADPFLSLVTPWGPLSSLQGMHPSESNDGPILWARHGEQTVPVFPASPNFKNPVLRNTGITDLLIGRRTMKTRQVPVHDRTPCHADHADDGLARHTTAAIGLLKAIYPPTLVDSKSPLHPSSSSFIESTSVGNYYSCDPNQSARIVKDVVVFDPRHYPELIERLRLDIMEPPASQCGSFWADDGELNQLHAEGFRYVRLHLRDNDIYFIPRNVVHQFKSVSAVTSIAWHVRLKNYYCDTYNNTTTTITSITTTPTTTTTTTTTATTATTNTINTLPVNNSEKDPSLPYSPLKKSYTSHMESSLTEEENCSISTSVQHHEIESKVFKSSNDE